MSKSLRAVVEELKELFKPQPFPHEKWQAALLEMDRLTAPPPPKTTKSERTKQIFFNKEEII